MGFNGDLESLTIHPACLPIQTITKCDGAVVHNNVTTLIPLLLQLYLARSEGDKQVLQICYRLCSNNYLIWSVRSHCFYSKDYCLFRGTEKLNNTWVLNDLLWPAIPRALQFICRKCTQIRPFICVSIQPYTDYWGWQSLPPPLGILCLSSSLLSLCSFHRTRYKPY